MKIPKEISSNYPYKGNFFQTNSGAHLHYLDEGMKEGTPTVFLHGNPTWSFFYRRLIAQLHEHGRCIVPDHIGCGLSDKPPSTSFTYDLKHHSENIFDLLKYLNIEEVNLVVHDWGGAIGLTALRNNSHRVKKLVLMNTAAFPSKNVPFRILLCRIPLIGSLLVRGLNGFAGPATHMAVTKPLCPEIKKGFLFPYQGWHNRIAVWKFVKDIPYEKNHPTMRILQETEKSLPNYKNIPVLACWGMKDFCFHEGFLEQWKSRLPNLTAHPITDAGHYLLEDNFEECLSIIKPFLFS